MVLKSDNKVLTNDVHKLVRTMQFVSEHNFCVFQCGN